MAMASMAILRASTCCPGFTFDCSSNLQRQNFLGGIPLCLNSAREPLLHDVCTWKIYGPVRGVAVGATVKEVTPPKVVPQAPFSAREDPVPVNLQPLPSIKTAKRVVLVRHGESTWNSAGRIQGSSDFAVLTPKGEVQAETSRQMLLDAKFDGLFYSPLARAKKTAEIIWGSRSAPIHVLDDLREIDLYSFQGLYKHEGKERYGDEYRMWQKSAANFQIDGHYPVRELWERASKCWQEILQSECNSVLVVAHNAVNQALVATATGLDPTYFRQLLQSNCGVSVLDFTPGSDGKQPHVCLERLNQTPGPPVVATGAGRKAKSRVILVRHGATESTTQGRFPAQASEPMNMLGIIQAQKTAELLLDVEVDTILCSPLRQAQDTAKTIEDVQAAADCLIGAECTPRWVERVEVPELAEIDLGAWKGQPTASVEVLAPGKRWQSELQQAEIPGGESIADVWDRAGRAWRKVLDVLGRPADGEPQDGDVEGKERVVVVVGHELVHVALLGHCLGLTPEALGKFHLDTGSLSVLDFPDGPQGQGILRCSNYTAHLGRWAVPVTRPSVAEEDY